MNDYIDVRTVYEALTFEMALMIVRFLVLFGVSALIGEMTTSDDDGPPTFRVIVPDGIDVAWSRLALAIVEAGPLDRSNLN